MPRDRAGTFDPVMVAKRQRRHLKEPYSVEVSPTLISAVTDAVMEDRSAFPTPDYVRRVLYLAITKASERWNRPVQYFALADTPGVRTAGPNRRHR